MKSSKPLIRAPHLLRRLSQYAARRASYELAYGLSRERGVIEADCEAIRLQAVHAAAVHREYYEYLVELGVIA